MAAPHVVVKRENVHTRARWLMGEGVWISEYNGRDEMVKSNYGSGCNKVGQVGFADQG